MTPYRRAALIAQQVKDFPGSKLYALRALLLKADKDEPTDPSMTYVVTKRSEQEQRG